MFTPTFVPAHQHREVRDALVHHGIAWLRGLDAPDDLLGLADALGEPVLGEDTDARGVKTVTSAHLGSALHTDRSNMKIPPALALISCKYQADRGGETILVDGRALLDALPENARCALSTTGSACFGRPGWERRGAIFEGDILRFRLDPHGLYTAAVWAHMPALQHTIDTLTRTVRLRTGQGYVLDNHRWLHGARPSHTTRTIQRILLTPHPDLNGPLGLRRSEP